MPDLFEELHRDSSSRQWTYLPYGPFADVEELTALVEAQCADPELVPHALLATRTGRATGVASYLRVEPAIGTIEVGHINYGMAMQGTAAATEAMCLMAAHVFDDLGYRRYEWKCDALNAASMSAARRLGFEYEGTWRNATMYRGRNRDTAWFAMTDADWAELRPVYESWLAPRNFDEQGRQRTSLSTAVAQARVGIDEEQGR